MDCGIFRDGFRKINWAIHLVSKIKSSFLQKLECRTFNFSCLVSDTYSKILEKIFKKCSCETSNTTLSYSIHKIPEVRLQLEDGWSTQKQIKSAKKRMPSHQQSCCTSTFCNIFHNIGYWLQCYLLTILCKHVKEDGFIFHFCKYWDNRTLLVCRTSAVQAYRCSSIIRMMDRWMVIVRGNKRERLLKMYKSYS